MIELFFLYLKNTKFAYLTQPYIAFFIEKYEIHISQLKIYGSIRIDLYRFKCLFNLCSGMFDIEQINIDITF